MLRNNLLRGQKVVGLIGYYIFQRNSA